MRTREPINCSEIIKLHEMLEADGIPHTFEHDSIWRGYQLCYPCNGDERVLSAILHMYSYGHEQGLIEIMGLLDPVEKKQGGGVAGWLTALDVYERIKQHWNGGKADE